MKEFDGLTVVVARRDPWISSEATRSSIGDLAPVCVVERAVDGLEGRSCSPPGQWTLPANPELTWAARVALEEVTEGWLLLLDADERLTESGVEEIREFLSHPGESRGAGFRRVHHFLGRALRASRPPKEAGIRLVRADEAWPDPAGGGFLVPEGAAPVRLQEALVRDAFASLEECMARLDFEASREARWLAGAGAGTSARRVVVAPFGAFLRRWILGGSILDGTLGLVQAAFEGAFDVVRTAKLWELGMPARLRRVPSLPEPPP